MGKAEKILIFFVSVPLTLCFVYEREANKKNLFGHRPNGDDFLACRVLHFDLNFIQRSREAKI